MSGSWTDWRIASEEKTMTRQRYDPTYHRDGSVTYWSVTLQQWVRSRWEDVADETYAQQGEAFRRRGKRALEESRG